MNIIDQKINQDLNIVRKRIDIDAVLKNEYQGKGVKKYYRINRLPYIIFYDRSGMMHSGLSYDGKFKKLDYLGPIKIIEKYIESLKAKKILELGAGNGANSGLLASKYPSISFFALDYSLKPLARYRKNKNFSQVVGDYHDLSLYEEDSFEIVFAIETICHTSNKTKVLEEIKRVLKPGGVFICFDMYSVRDESGLSENELLIKSLVAKGMAVDEFESIEKFKKDVEKAKMIIEKNDVISNLVIPTADMLRERSLHILGRTTWKGKLFGPIFSQDILMSFAAGMFLSAAIKNKIFSYYFQVLGK
ncbi:MAG: class I SAM-dependent methyltransferase [Patescibacteria group bacterium]|jgi:sterol 24-C-methyltransferase